MIALLSNVCKAISIKAAMVSKVTNLVDQFMKQLRRSSMSLYNKTFNVATNAAF
jgi:hypothetical protein